MSCYLPYCVIGVPYFSVLTQCGFEEQGGTVDCIQPINMSGINELLVSQGGSAMPRHHRERLNELETMLEFPPQVSAAELDSRYHDLCKVLEKARDTFSCRLDEEQENPFQELRIQLQKAKDRFHARLAGENSSRPLRSSRFKTKSVAKNAQNPFQELRDAFRMARKHFIPLIDQYISTGNNKNSDAIRERAGSRLDGQYMPTTAVEVNPTSIEDSSTILCSDPIDDCSKPRPVNIYTQIRASEPVSTVINEESPVDCNCTFLRENSTEDCPNPPISCQDLTYRETVTMRISTEDCPNPPISCQDLTYRETVTMRINQENAVGSCWTIVSDSPAEDCSMRHSDAPKAISSLETNCVEINPDNVVDSGSVFLEMNPMEKCRTPLPSIVYEEMIPLENGSLEIEKESAEDCSYTILSTNPTEDCPPTQLSNPSNEMSLRENLSVETNKNDAVDSFTTTSVNDTNDYSEQRPSNMCNEVSSEAISNRLGRDEVPHDSFNETVVSPDNASIGRLEAMITMELQRRKGGVELLPNQDRNDGDRIMTPPPIIESIAEVGTGKFEQLSSPGKESP